MTDYQQTHWDIAEVGAVCHDECAVAQIKAAALAMRERCAKACEHNARLYPHGGTGWESSTECAAAVRALEV